MDVYKGIFPNGVQHVSLDVNEVGDDAVVHYSMSPKDEGMVVDLCDRCGGGRSDVAKGSSSGNIGTNALEVVVIGGRFAVLVHGWSDPLCFVELSSGLRVPDDAETVNIVEAVPEVDLFLGRIAIGSVRDQLWQVMFVDLLGESVVLY